MGAAHSQQWNLPSQYLKQPIERHDLKLEIFVQDTVSRTSQSTWSVIQSSSPGATKSEAFLVTGAENFLSFMGALGQDALSYH